MPKDLNPRESLRQEALGTSLLDQQRQVLPEAFQLASRKGSASAIKSGHNSPKQKSAKRHSGGKKASAKHHGAAASIKAQKVTVKSRVKHPGELFRACAWVESQFNAHKVGDGGRAWGIVQIWPCTVKDVNHAKNLHGKRAYKLADRFSIKKSREMFVAYLAHYGALYKERTGKKANAEVWARIWKGGPDGWRNEATKEYWERVALASD